MKDLRPSLAALVALLALLAGCVSVPAEEQLTISINDVSDIPYVIAVPLWQWNGGPNMTDWMEHAKIHSGQVTQFHMIDTDIGPAIRIAGNGTVTIGFEDVRSTSTARMASGDFTTGTGPGGMRPLLVVETGDVDVNWIYEVNAENCFGTGSFWWQANGTGVHEALPGGRMTFDRTCSP